MYLPEDRCCMKLAEPQNKVPIIHTYYIILRAASRAAAASKMERSVIIINGFQPLTIITKRFILDVTLALDPPLVLQNTIL